MDVRKSITASRLAIVGLVVVVGVGGGLPASRAQAPSGVLRLAFLPQWAILQHRGAGGSVSPGLGTAVESGVVDRTVFVWQRGVIQRQSLVPKPIRLVPEPEAVALGGRGRFDLGTVRPPTGQAAWTEIEVGRSGAGADDVLVLEIGGERNTVTQVLETLLVADPARGLVEVPLARPALITGVGVPVVTIPLEQPLPPAMAQRFREEAGMGILVARSPQWYVRNGGTTVNGPADTMALGDGDWREGDRVFLRISAAALARGLPGLVLVWKDRKLQNDPDLELQRRSALPFPVVR